MTARGAPGSVLGTQFDDFLLAPVFEERNGPLTVLSALARLDVDPWHIAATLAQLPRPTAAQELASMFAGLPDAPVDRYAIATRVVAFLPSLAGSQAPSHGGPTSAARQASARQINFPLICIVCLLIGLVVQGFVLSHRAEPASPTARRPVASSPVVPPGQASTAP